MDRKPLVMHALPNTTAITWLQRLCDPAVTLDIKHQQMGIASHSLSLLADAHRDVMCKQMALVQSLVMPPVPARPGPDALALWSLDALRQRNEATLAASRAVNDAWINYGWQAASLYRTWLHDAMVPLDAQAQGHTAAKKPSEGPVKGR